MITKHETNKMSQKADVSFSSEVFEKLKTHLDLALGFLETLSLYEDTATEDESSDIIVDQLTMLIVDDIKPLEIYRVAKLSTSTSLNFYFNDTLDLIIRISEQADKYNILGLPLDADEIQAIKESVTKIISGISYFIWFEFDLEKTYTDIINDVSKDAIAVNECVHNYLVTYMADLYELVKSIKVIKDKYKLSLRVFDENPELEEDFSKIMGPDINFVDEENLTIELVKKVIDGTLKPEDVLTEMMKFNISNEGTEEAFSDSLANMIM